MDEYSVSKQDVANSDHQKDSNEHGAAGVLLAAGNSKKRPAEEDAESLESEEQRGLSGRVRHHKRRPPSFPKRNMDNSSGTASQSLTIPDDNTIDTTGNFGPPKSPPVEDEDDLDRKPAAKPHFRPSTQYKSTPPSSSEEDGGDGDSDSDSDASVPESAFGSPGVARAMSQIDPKPKRAREPPKKFAALEDAHMTAFDSKAKRQPVVSSAPATAEGRTGAGPNVDVSSNEQPSPFAALTDGTREFLQSVGIEDIDTLFNTATGEIAKKYSVWREKQGMVALKGSGPAATVSAWKTLVGKQKRRGSPVEVVLSRNQSSKDGGAHPRPSRGKPRQGNASSKDTSSKAETHTEGVDRHYDARTHSKLTGDLVTDFYYNPHLLAPNSTPYGDLDALVRRSCPVGGDVASFVNSMEHLVRVPDHPRPPHDLLPERNVSQLEISSTAEVPPKRNFSRLGITFQARIPRCGMYRDKRGEQDYLGHTQLWDPVRADEAERRGEDIDGFLSKARGLSQTEMFMDLLHRVNYSVESAKWNLNQILRWSGGIQSSDLSSDEAERFRILVERRKINKFFLRLLPNEIGRSRCDCLIHYYRWKAKCPEVYRKIKSVWKKRHRNAGLREVPIPDELNTSESFDPTDFCTICGDGGSLIVCDFCDSAYHFQTCLDPPLTSEEVPEGKWSCPKCERKEARAVRAELRSSETRILSPDSTNIQRAPSTPRIPIPIYQSPDVSLRSAAQDNRSIPTQETATKSPQHHPSDPRGLFDDSKQEAFGRTHMHENDQPTQSANVELPSKSKLHLSPTSGISQHGKATSELQQLQSPRHGMSHCSAIRNHSSRQPTLPRTLHESVPSPRRMANPSVAIQQAPQAPAPDACPEFRQSSSQSAAHGSYRPKKHSPQRQALPRTLLESQASSPTARGTATQGAHQSSTLPNEASGNHQRNEGSSTNDDFSNLEQALSL